MADLFNYKTEYPNSPGYKRPGTSKAAAEAIKPRVMTLRDKVIWALKDEDEKFGAGMTADECAARMGKSILSIRPRFSELKRLGLIFDTGMTRPNESGVQASVWRAL